MNRLLTKLGLYAALGLLTGATNAQTAGGVVQQHQADPPARSVPARSGNMANIPVIEAGPGADATVLPREIQARTTREPHLQTQRTASPQAPH